MGAGGGFRVHALARLLLGRRGGGEAGRFGLGAVPRYLPIGAAWHGGAGDGVEEGQAVPVLHLGWGEG